MIQSKKVLFSLTILVSLSFILALRSDAQQFSLKTNLLYDATASVNLGAELRVAPHWSIDISGDYNSWKVASYKWKHWDVMPEARYWFCEATAGHFLALHAIGGKYNIGHLGFARDLFGIGFSDLRDHRYQGWAVGGGLGYGYSWILGRHWNMEAEIAVGYIHADYDVFECKGCGKKVDSGRKNFVAPTKAALNIVYVF